MINNNFESYKLSRELKRSGIEYTFFRKDLNEYKEPQNDSRQFICSFKGLYHEQSSYVSQSISEASKVRSKFTPMILCLLDEEVKKLQQGDFVLIDSVEYTLIEVKDIQNWGLIADISLEVSDGN